MCIIFTAGGFLTAVFVFQNLWNYGNSETPEKGDHDHADDKGKQVERKADLPVIPELVISDALNDQVVW